MDEKVEGKKNRYLCNICNIIIAVFSA